MSTLAVAKKDFRDSIRSRALLVITVLFALLTGGGAFVSSWAGEILEVGGDQTTLDLLLALQTPASFIVPIIALLIGYGAISRERESGSLKFLLGLPHTRRDVIFGKVLGRTAVVAVSITIGFTVGMVAIFAFTGSLSPVEYIGFMAMTILVGVRLCLYWSWHLRNDAIDNSSRGWCVRTACAILVTLGIYRPNRPVCHDWFTLG